MNFPGRLAPDGPCLAAIKHKLRDNRKERCTILVTIPMLLKSGTLEGVAAGTIDLAFRRWKRPTVRAGGTLRTHRGVLSIEAVDVIGEGQITDKDARRAGFSARSELLSQLKPKPETQLYRVKLRLAGPDPRVALRNKSSLAAADVTQIESRLARFDATGRHGPWTSAVLELIAKRPGDRAAELAEAMGRDTPSFKTDVRKLKELGLTESLSPGYRLSPRGKAFFSRRGSR